MEGPDYLRKVLPNRLKSGGAVRLGEPVGIQIVSPFQVGLQVLVRRVHRREEALEFRASFSHELERVGRRRRAGLALLLQDLLHENR